MPIQERTNPIRERLHDMLEQNKMGASNEGRLIWKWLHNPIFLFMLLLLIVGSLTGYAILRYRVDIVEDQTGIHSTRIQTLERIAAARDAQYESINETLTDIKEAIIRLEDRRQ